jgi:hypothetical protein
MGKPDDVEIIEWSGKRWRRYPSSEHTSNRTYFSRGTADRPIWLHRAVWADAHGPIPAGHHIHHIDGNPANNAVDNLQCLTPQQHADMHPWSDERRAQQSVLLDRIRPLTKTWHASPEGLEAHRRIGAMAYDNFIPEPKPCDQCGATFEPKALGNRDRFCSNRCKSAFRRASGVDNVTRTCACGASFTVNRYSKQTACSRSCGGRQRGRTLRTRVRSDS